MRYFIWLNIAILFQACGSTDPKIVRSTDLQSPDKIINTELGPLTLSKQVWGVREYKTQEGRLESSRYYEAVASIELKEKPHDSEILIPYELRFSTSQKGAIQLGRWAGEGFGYLRTTLRYDSSQGLAIGKISTINPIKHLTFEEAKFVDSLSIEIYKPSLLAEDTSARMSHTK